MGDASGPVILCNVNGNTSGVVGILRDRNVTFRNIFTDSNFIQPGLFRNRGVSDCHRLGRGFNSVVILLYFNDDLPSIVSGVLGVTTRRRLCTPRIPIVNNNLFSDRFLGRRRSRFR